MPYTLTHTAGVRVKHKRRKGILGREGGREGEEGWREGWREGGGTEGGRRDGGMYVIVKSMG